MKALFAAQNHQRTFLVPSVRYSQYIEPYATHNSPIITQAIQSNTYKCDDRLTRSEMMQIDFLSLRIECRGML